MKTNRRKFIRNTALATGGVFIASQIRAKKKEVVECGAAQSVLAGTIISAKDGPWSDAATWAGVMPTADDTIVVNHIVNYDMPTSTFAGVNINASGTLVFNGSKSCELVSTKNVNVLGRLVMRPDNANILHVLKFAGINEASFVGGGMDILDTDVGLWVMDGGQLDLQGTTKTSWVRPTTALAKGSTSVTIDGLSGWAESDEIAIAPTDSPITGDTYITGFDERVISNVYSNLYSFSALTFNHPRINGIWSPEIMNLTRNVRVEGTAIGKAHVFIRSAKHQNIKYVAFRYLGPRKDKNADSVKDLVLGRYGLHFHHSMDGSRGSVVEGCVMRDTDNHAYVVHVSHGVTIRSCVSYNTTETAFWYDEASQSHDVLYENNCIAKVKFLNRSLALDTGDPDTPNFAVAGMLLGMGDDNVARGNVVVGSNTGDEGSGGAYFWQANNEGVWTFEHNMAHNCTNGLLTWQNSNKNHIVEGTNIYHCQRALMHGAYANSYTYRGGKIYGCPGDSLNPASFRVEASSGDTNRVRFENIEFDGAGITDYGILVFSSPIPAPMPTYVRGCSFRNFLKAGIIDRAANELKCIDVINCTAIGTLAAVDPGATASEVVRVQPASGQAVRITKSGTSNISPFAPTIYGTGKGLKGEYFNNSALSGTPAHTRIDSVVAFQEWSTGIHYRITGQAHSMRWSGQIMPQYTETYTFTLAVSGAVRLWVDGKLLLDRWSDNYPVDFKSAGIALVAARLYDIRIEYFNNDEKTGINFYWQSPSLPLEYVPQSQLYSGDIVVIPPSTDPMANAGMDKTITLPSNQVFLDGAAMNGNPVWSKTSGPAATITSPNSAGTNVTGLTAGTYVFRLTVGTAFDEVVVQVNNPVTQTTTLKITATSLTTKTYWTLKVTSTSTDFIKVTILDSLGRVKETFSNLTSGASGPVGASYPKGTYTAKAEQGTTVSTIMLTKN